MGIEAAIIGSAAVGAVSSSKSAKSQSSAANAASASADAAALLQYETSMEQLDFAKQQYQDWQNVFGPIQQNLANYYNSLSSDTVAALGLQSIEQEYHRSATQLDESLAKRGMTNSGALAAGFTELEKARMLGRADVRAQAPLVASSQKASFLSAGMGQLQGVQSGVNTAFTNQISLLGNQYSNQMANATNLRNQSAQSAAGIGTSIGQGINTYLTYDALKNNPSSWWR